MKIIIHYYALVALLSITSTVDAFSIPNSCNDVMTPLHSTVNDYENTPEEEKDNSRRNLLLSTAAIGSSVLFATNNDNISSSINEKKAPSNIRTISSVKEAIQTIDDSCDRRFLHAVVASDYRFLYRGISDNKMSIREEPFDLLSDGTYDSPEALKWFQRVEEVLQNDKVKPSNGHLAITSAEAASAWGTTAASIWPLVQQQGSEEKEVHYAWFQQGGLFYPPRSMELDRSKLIIDGRDCGRDSLEDALSAKECEILVATTSFLAVPVALEEELRRGLQGAFLM